jgi:putative membrane protein
MSDNERDIVATPERGMSSSHTRRGAVGWMIGALVILALLAVFAGSFFFYGPMTGQYGYYPRPFFFFPFGFVFFIIIFFVVRGLFWGWGWGWRGGYSRGYWHHGGHYGDATEILKQRYAKGEITKDQFDQMMRDLQAHEA